MSEAKQQRPLDIELAARELTLGMLSKTNLRDVHKKLVGVAPGSKLNCEEICKAIFKHAEKSKDTAADADAIVAIYKKDRKPRKWSIREMNRDHALSEKVHWFEHDTAMEAARQRLCKKLPTDEKTLPLLIAKMQFEFTETVVPSESGYGQDDGTTWTEANCIRHVFKLGQTMTAADVAVFSGVAWNEKKQVIEVKFDREYTFGGARKITRLRISPYITNIQNTWAVCNWNWLDFSAEAESSESKSTHRMQCLRSWTEQWTPAKDLAEFVRPREYATAGGSSTTTVAWTNPAYRAPAVKRVQQQEDDDETPLSEIIAKRARTS